MKFLTENWLLLLLVVLAAGIYLVFACPYLRDRGHDVTCYVGFAFFAIVFIYARAPRAIGKKRPRRK